MSRSHPKCHGPSGHVCRKPSGRFCLDCGNPAGTLWGPYWCPDCDAVRLDRITASLKSIKAEADQEKTEIASTEGAD